MERSESYYFTVPRSAKLQREWDTIVSRIVGMNGPCRFLYLYRAVPDEQSSKKVLLQFLFLTKVDRKHSPLSEDVAELSDIFGYKVKLLPITAKSAPKEVLDALPVARKQMFSSMSEHVQGTDEVCLIPETTDELLAQVDAMTGFSYFKEVCHNDLTLIDRMNKLGIRGNYNTLIVTENGVNEFFFLEKLYALLVSKGVITDHRIVRGDLDDATRTTTNAPLLYYISERWDFGRRDGIMWGLPQETSFHLLCQRSNVYVTAMDRAQYEKAKELDYVKALFAHTVELKELCREEKMELLKCSAKKYGFAFDTKSFRGSDVLKMPYPALQTQLTYAIQGQLSDASRTELVLRASDFEAFAAKKKTSNAQDELEALIGLESVKACVREISALLKNRGRSALPCLHMVFRGNPGTGKTTVARLIGKMFGELGVIKDEDKFVETDRNGLVSQYLGGTAAKTASVVKDAMGGVLFIDEAYALANNSASYDYGHEAIDTLVKRLEDHRKDFVCIMAGYTKEMDQMLDSNPGLRDRIQFYIDFPDYSAQELVQIYCKYAQEEEYQIDAEAKDTFLQMAEQIIRAKDQNFSNARLVRKVFERTRMKQALRTDGNIITAADIEVAFAEPDMQTVLGKSQAFRQIGFGCGQV